jgi:hypothetical protein
MVMQCECEQGSLQRLDATQGIAGGSRLLVVMRHVSRKWEQSCVLVQLGIMPFPTSCGLLEW